MIAALVLGMFTISVAFLLPSRRPAEPRYGSKSLHEWLADLGVPSKLGTATRAIRALGTNAFPVLFFELRQTESPLFGRVHLLILRGRRWFPLEWPSAGDRSRQAINGFKALGPEAAPAIPEIIGLFRGSSLYYGQHDPAYQAARALGAIGSPAVQPLFQALTNADPAVRCHACFTLGYFSSLRTNTALPHLIARVSDPDPHVRIRALLALHSYHDISPEAVAALRDRLSDPVSRVRLVASGLLGEMENKARDAALALIQALRNEEAMPDRPAGPGIFDEVSKQEVQLAISNALARITVR